MIMSSSQTSLFIPIIILLGISSGISILVSLFKFRALPTFVLEVIAGIVFGRILTKYFQSHNYTEMVDFLYVIGFSFIMFLSGYDVNLKVFKDKTKSTKNHFNIARTCLLIIGLIYLLSIAVAFIFIGSMDKVVLGVILLAITFSSTFAGVVVPLINVEHLHSTHWGEFIITFSFLNEFISVVLLTLFMIANNFTLTGLWSYLLIIGIFLLLFFILKIRRGRRIEEGMVFFSTKIIIVALGACVFLGEKGGGEYVLGAFLLGFFLRLVHLNHHKMKFLESIGYGFFIPVFFVILGTKIDITHFIHHPRMFLTSFLLFIVFLIVKLPMLHLLHWYKKATVATSVALSSVTLVVAVAAEHLGLNYGIFSHEFGQTLIFAAVLTTILGPLVYEISCFTSLRHLRTEEKEIIYDEDFELS